MRGRASSWSTERREPGRGRSSRTSTPSGDEIGREPTAGFAETEYGDDLGASIHADMKTELLTIFATFVQYGSRTMAVSSSYDALREAIVRGDIAPDARLVESDISTTFDMSRGAVRTALIRLEQDGLVVREPHRGARVRRVSDEEAVEILEARAVLEGLAVRQAAERIDDGGVHRLREAVSPVTVSSSNAAISSARRTRTATCTRPSSSCRATRPPCDSSRASTRRRFATSTARS